MIRSVRFLGSKVPKLATVTLSPSSNVADMAAMTALTKVCVFSLPIPVFFARVAINSLLFTVCMFMDNEQNYSTTAA